MPLKGVNGVTGRRHRNQGRALAAGPATCSCVQRACVFCRHRWGPVRLYHSQPLGERVMKTQLVSLPDEPGDESFRIQHIVDWWNALRISDDPARPLWKNWSGLSMK